MMKILCLMLIWRVERCGLHHQRIFLRSTHVLRNQIKKGVRWLGLEQKEETTASHNCSKEGTA
uniref:Uncharacterized protein n=1 Tax=Triticum urartu TaxID=4572 RepID=A0A8R7QGH0_TRIUA